MPQKNNRKKAVTAEKALERLAGLCARSEQCSADIREKLRKMDLSSDDADAVMGRLIDMKFVDDARYASALARDKVRFSGWGKRKIREYLLTKRLPADIIADAIAGIEPEDYKQALIRSAKAKVKSLDLRNFDHRTKLIKHLMSRGFEPDLAIKIVQNAVKRLPEE